MPLPEGGNTVDWPPKSWRLVYDRYAEHAAWYGGDPDRLAAVYGGTVTSRGRAPWWRFWARAGEERSEHQARSQLHVPLAGDIAATNAALLFSEAPDIRIPEAHQEKAPDGAKQAQDRLEAILAGGDVLARLTEAAEEAAALGGVFLAPDWDTELADVPLLSVVRADAAIPEFRFGILTAVTLWRVVESDDKKIWRHLQRYEVGPEGKGVILHGLYEGTDTRLGERRELAANPATEGLLDVVSLPFDGLGVRYIPNRRPNRRFRGLALGESDYADAEGLMDALDETYTSWMRDIRLGKARILVPEEYLEVIDGKPRFNVDQEVFVPLDTPNTSNTFDVTPQQFLIRVQEHEQTALNLIERIVSHAGYSPQTFGLNIRDRAESGTALRLRERRTLMTQQRKRRSWEGPLEDVLAMLLAIDREVFRTAGLERFRPSVTLGDSLTPDDGEIATTVEIMKRSGTASTEYAVRLLHPDWTDEQVKAEVQRIREDRGLYVPSPDEIGIP